MTHAVRSCIVFAARYAHHRATSAAHAVISAAKQSWHKLDANDRAQLIRESHEATENLDDWRRFREWAEQQPK